MKCDVNFGIFAYPATLSSFFRQFLVRMNAAGSTEKDEGLRGARGPKWGGQKTKLVIMARNVARPVEPSSAPRPSQKHPWRSPLMFAEVSPDIYQV